jgi:hypothetical protein
VRNAHAIAYPSKIRIEFSPIADANDLPELIHTTRVNSALGGTPSAGHVSGLDSKFCMPNVMTKA